MQFFEPPYSFLLPLVLGLFFLLLFGILLLQWDTFNSAKIVQLAGVQTHADLSQ